MIPWNPLNSSSKDVPLQQSQFLIHSCFTITIHKPQCQTMYRMCWLILMCMSYKLANKGKHSWRIAKSTESVIKSILHQTNWWVYVCDTMDAWLVCFRVDIWRVIVRVDIQSYDEQVNNVFTLSDKKNST